MDSPTHYICVWYINSIYLSTFQVNTVINIELILQNVSSHARVMVSGVVIDLNNDFAVYHAIFASPLRSLTQGTKWI